ncbi:hypothetical protein GGU10DRAFT_266126 [Lentinula aff. detonsa]|uniref:Uncharacterized protein n=1 Tax=Lentinula aff. detonsa TaxID=2804958 RepID=A0AA38NPV5_9AGAR|nr:hypothetical protein GGU10DRAFT_266126 [Lentinula aff. detonsa]
MVGFFKRILSLGSKKSSKRKQARAARSNDWVDEVGAQVHQPQTSDEDNEIAVNLLLRSSSARYAVVSETDYTTLPPLPHPINHAIRTPTESTASLPSASITRCGTYTVKVHPRQRHSSTEFPMANRPLVEEPKTPQPRCRAQTTGDDSTHLQGLRRDPSVASLLDLYDEHGHLPIEAFSNTPPREGRAQTQRTGSTLRELLGEPDNGHRRNTSGSFEGDISWAERFLGEANSAASSVSSLILQTPDGIGSRFSDSLLINNAPHDSTLVSDHDLCSTSNFLDNPAISSMEVELSSTSEVSQAMDSPYVTENPHYNQDPRTPRRASEVFGFLTEKRKSRPPEATLDRHLPELPSAFSTPSDKDSSGCPALSRFSVDSSALSHNNATISALIDTPSIESSKHVMLNDKPIDSLFQQRPISRMLTNDESSLYYSQHPSSDQLSGPLLDDVRKVKVILTAPTKVIVTAPTPLADTSDRPTSRMPRGSRSMHRHRSRSNAKERDYSQGLVERSNSTNSSDPFTPIPSRPMKLRRSSASLSSTYTDSGAAHTHHHSHISNSKPLEKESRSRSRRQGSTKSLMSAVFDKENKYENTLGLAVTPNIPFTPIRSNSSSRSSSLLRTAVTPASFKPPRGMTPSPASSSELSPVGKMMMLDVRRQKIKTMRETQEKEARSQKAGGGEGRKIHRRTERTGELFM